MAWSENFYSRLVAWMKIILPLTALAILATLFLLSQDIDPTKSIPIASIDLTQRAQDQGATNAVFTGVTSSGDEVLISAATARPSTTDPRLINAQTVLAKLRLEGGGTIDVVSDEGDLHQSKMTANLQGNVRLRTSTGYEITTERLETQIDTLYAESPGVITGKGPPGDISAGRMILTHRQETNTAHLLFTDRVKLIYIPQSAEDD